MINSEQREFIKKIITECPVYAGQEALLEEFCNETCIQAQNLLKGKANLEPLKAYIKRIANLSILEVLKRSRQEENISINTITEDFFVQSDVTQEHLRTQNKQPDWDLASKNPNQKFILPSQISLSDNQISNIKTIISNNNKENRLKQCKDIFELRYLQGLSNSEIANHLEMDVLDVDNKLLFLLNEIKQECFSN
jgi:RNA polymerase sigma factor (sigma-70 family)